MAATKTGTDILADMAVARIVYRTFERTVILGSEPVPHEQAIQKAKENGHDPVYLSHGIGGYHVGCKNCRFGGDVAPSQHEELYFYGPVFHYRCIPAKEYDWLKYAEERGIRFNVVKSEAVELNQSSRRNRPRGAVNSGILNSENTTPEKAAKHARKPRTKKFVRPGE